jgi:hypothetical protein
MNLRPHAVTQGSINLLVAPNAAHAFKAGTHNGGKKMPPIASDLQVRAGQPLGDKLFNVERARIRHSAIILETAVGRIQVRCFWTPWQGENYQTLAGYGEDLRARPGRSKIVHLGA